MQTRKTALNSGNTVFFEVCPSEIEISAALKSIQLNCLEKIIVKTQQNSQDFHQIALTGRGGACISISVKRADALGRCVWVRFDALIT